MDEGGWVVMMIFLVGSLSRFFVLLLFLFVVVVVVVAVAVAMVIVVVLFLLLLSCRCQWIHHLHHLFDNIGYYYSGGSGTKTKYHAAASLLLVVVVGGGAPLVELKQYINLSFGVALAVHGMRSSHSLLLTSLL